MLLALWAVGSFVSESSYGPIFKPMFRPVIQGTDRQHLTVDVACLSPNSLAKKRVAKSGRRPGRQCHLESGRSARPAGTASHPVKLCGHAAFLWHQFFCLATLARWVASHCVLSAGTCVCTGEACEGHRGHASPRKENSRDDAHCPPLRESYMCWAPGHPVGQC